MMAGRATIRFMDREVRTLLIQARRLAGFSAQIPMVRAAQPADAAFRDIEDHLARSRQRILFALSGFLDWLDSEGGRMAPAPVVQRRFSLLKLQFTGFMTQFDLFSDALGQRSEREAGLWLAGLDRLAEDALWLPRAPYRAPPLVCYLDRGIGAAIRRARTRLPGGGVNPVAIIRVPRERLIGSGISSSVIHEVGHQGAALLDLVASLRAAIDGRGRGDEADAWQLWSGWISEIIADFWSIAHLGITSTLGLIGVVSLPPAFVFRIQRGEPHPAPWIRVRLSAAIGARLFPDPQWAALRRQWEQLYPVPNDPELRSILTALDATCPALIDLLVDHRPKALRGRRLITLFPVGARQPAQLRSAHSQVGRDVQALAWMAPSAALATIGQARADGLISPAQEAATIEPLFRALASRRPADRSETFQLKEKQYAE